MNRQTPEQAQFEDRLRLIVSSVPELSFGYIGNDERWGDDRLLHIWVRDLREKNGNLVSLWCREAVRLTQEDVSKAWSAVNGFRVALRLARQ